MSLSTRWHTELFHLASSFWKGQFQLRGRLYSGGGWGGEGGSSDTSLKCQKQERSAIYPIWWVRHDTLGTRNLCSYLSCFQQTSQFSAKTKGGRVWRRCRSKRAKVCLAWRSFLNQRWALSPPQFLIYTIISISQGVGWLENAHLWNNPKILPFIPVKRNNYQQYKNQVRAEDDVVIKVGFAGLCGTDLHIVSVWSSYSFGLIVII